MLLYMLLVESAKFGAIVNDKMTAGSVAGSHMGCSDNTAIQQLAHALSDKMKPLLELWQAFTSCRRQ